MQMDINRTQTNYHEFLASSDPRAWEEFYLVYFQMMVFWAGQRGCNEDEARDLAQEKIVQLFTRDKFSSFKSRGNFSFRSWLKSVICNEAKDYIRRRRGIVRTESDDFREIGELRDRFQSEAASNENWDQKDLNFYLRCTVNRALRLTLSKRSGTEASIFFERVVKKAPKTAVCRKMGIEGNIHDVYLSRFRKALGDELSQLLNDRKNYLGPLDEALSERDLSIILEEIYYENQGQLDTMVEENTFIEDRKDEELKSLLRLISENPPPSNDADWMLVLQNDHKQWIELKEGLTIGRDSKNDIVLASRGVSSLHASIQRLGDNWLIQDEKSTNHVYINNKRVDQNELLCPGDWVQISNNCLIYVGRVSAGMD